MPPESHQAVERLVVAFPFAAAWIIVLLVGVIGLLVAYLGRKFLSRMDDQDRTLEAIKALLASEVQKLREMHHAIDKRVTAIEAACNVEAVRWGRRTTERDDER